MELASNVLRLLLRNGGPLSEVVSFEIGDIVKLCSVVQEHLSSNELLSRAKLNSYLIQFKQKRTILGVRAVGFCFVVIAHHALLKSSPDVFPTTEQFFTKYPEYMHLAKSEQTQLHVMCNTMIAALRILDGKNNKTTLLEIVARICDGDHAQFVTGGGKIGEAKRVIPVERFFIRESGIEPEKSKKGQRKRRYSEDSETSSTSPGTSYAPTDSDTTASLEAPAAAKLEPSDSDPPSLSEDIYASIATTWSQLVGTPFPLWDEDHHPTAQAAEEESKQLLF